MGIIPTTHLEIKNENGFSILLVINDPYIYAAKA